jgi:hypothetical protein
MSHTTSSWCGSNTTPTSAYYSLSSMHTIERRTRMYFQSIAALIMFILA